MRNNLIIVFLSLFFSVKTSVGNSQSLYQDSLAVVDLYNNTNGPGWVNHTNWLTSAPISTWYGIIVDSNRVTWVTLSSNNLIGTIPPSIKNLSNLLVLWLNNNQLSGTIPAELGKLTKAALILDDNLLTGPIPSSLDSMDKYSYISLSHNKLNFNGLEDLTSKITFVFCDNQQDLPLIKNNNILSVAAGGNISNNTYKWYLNDSLIATKTGDSTFSISTPGNYSVEITNKIAFKLTLYSIATINAQDSLALVDLFNSTNGVNWLKHENWLSSNPASTWKGVTARRGKVMQVQLFSNNLTGTIPSSIGNLSNVQLLDLSGNKITGNLPASLGNLQNVQNLFLYNNQLSGTIPSALGNLGTLFSLDLKMNLLDGNIPSSLGNLSNLASLVIGSNHLTGNIPASLGNLTKLNTLNLTQNSLTGPIPKTIGNLQNLTDLILNDNQLTGSIPIEFGRLKKMGMMLLYNNQLTGSIPDSLCYLTLLARLQLQNNKLTGRIPDSIGRMGIDSFAGRQLFDLQLQNNNLSGPVPASISKCKLVEYNISNNNFTFDGMENQPQIYPGNSKTYYSPQLTLPYHLRGNNISVSAGGILANDTFHLYKDGVLYQTQTGDSNLLISGPGKYYITVTNPVAPLLTLTTDTLTIKLALADSSITVTENITGSNTTDINDGIHLLASLSPTAGSNALSGQVTTSVTIDSTVIVYNDQPFVKRHFDITPSNNPSTSQATVTLYFTQNDFDNFNSYVAANNLSYPLLPTSGVDNGNVRIIQYHGSFTGSSNPGNYSGNPIIIIPVVKWDTANLWWSVTFPVNGFSGFYISTVETTLPFVLKQFIGTSVKKSVVLSWITENEKNKKEYQIEWKSGSGNFSTIGTVKAQNYSPYNSYLFTDSLIYKGTLYYRLKIVNNDSGFNYSTILPVTTADSTIALFVYPNPATTTATILFPSPSVGPYTLEVSDINGKSLYKLTGTSTTGINEIMLDIQKYPVGIYLVSIIRNDKSKVTIKLFKQ